MPRFAANISLMFAEHPFLDRFDAAAAAGFKAVECQLSYEQAIPAIKERLDRTGLALALINTRPGDPVVGRKFMPWRATASIRRKTRAPSSTISEGPARRRPRSARRF
jgi:hydroxypyruvate isomerase